jgi:hypothetical protein
MKQPERAFPRFTRNTPQCPTHGDFMRDLRRRVDLTPDIPILTQAKTGYAKLQ